MSSTPKPDLTIYGLASYVEASNLSRLSKNNRKAQLAFNLFSMCEIYRSIPIEINGKVYPDLATALASLGPIQRKTE
jgi:hypothetical protein